jgi:hypothetical protein
MLPRRHRSRELWLALLGILSISLIYLAVVRLSGQIPAAAGFFGHLIGVLGFILMLMTETLYSLRKRSRLARGGRLADWLQLHIFTGIVGPFMVLLHSAWEFHGLAGLTLLLTVIIVVSGFIGRYIYTRVPRTLDGAELGAAELQQQLAVLEAQAQSGRGPARELKARQRELNRLRRQMGSLATARRLLGLWHAIHIPIGMALFTAAFVHAIAAFYYATLLR